MDDIQTLKGESPFIDLPFYSNMFYFAGGLMENITTKISNYRNELEEFVSVLESEKKYYRSFGVDTLVNAELLFIEKRDNKIIGVGGLWRRYGISRPFAVIRKEYQRKGLGKKFDLNTLKEARCDHNFVMGIVYIKNKAQLKNLFSMSYKIAGDRFNSVYYVVAPFNTRGQIFYYALRGMFIFLKIYDFFTSSKSKKLLSKEKSS